MNTENQKQPWAKGKAFDKPNEIHRTESEIRRWITETARALNGDGAEQNDLLCFLLASVLLGPYPDDIAALLGLPAVIAQGWADNLRRNGNWKSDETSCESWFNERNGMLCFVLDYLTAQGLIEACGRRNGKTLFRAVPGRHISDCN